MLEHLVNSALDLTAQTPQRSVVVGAAAPDHVNRLTEHDTQARAVEEGKPMQRFGERNPEVKATASSEGVADEVEQIVAADECERHRRRSTPNRRPDEAVALTPSR